MILEKNAVNIKSRTPKYAETSNVTPMTSNVEIHTCFLLGHVTLLSSARASLKKFIILSKPFAP